MTIFKTFILTSCLSITTSAGAMTIPSCGQAWLLASGLKFQILGRLLNAQQPTIATFFPNYDLQRLSQVAFKILEQKGIENVHVVGLGRSPFIFTDIIEAMVPGGTSTIPLSYNARIPLKDRLYPYAAKKSARGPYSKGGIKSYSQIPVLIPKDELRARLFQLLDKFLPSPSQLRGKVLLITDYSEYGSSLINFYIDLLAWKNDRKVDVEIHPVFLEDHSFDDNYWGNGRWYREHFGREGIDPPPDYSLISLSNIDSELRHDLNSQIFKAFAPFNHIALDQVKSIESISPNPLHDLYFQAVEQDFRNAAEMSAEFRDKIEIYRRQK